MPVKCQRPFVTLVGDKYSEVYTMSGHYPYSYTTTIPYQPVTIQTKGCQIGVSGIPRIAIVNGKIRKFYVRTTVRSGHQYLVVDKGTISNSTNIFTGPYWWGSESRSSNYYRDFLSIPNRDWFETSDIEAELFRSAASNVMIKSLIKRRPFLLLLLRLKKPSTRLQKLLELSQRAFHK
jgi:hypothetical protein